jgi:protein TonB
LSGTATTPPQSIRQVNPQYTDAARQARISGVVIMAAVIHKDGSISVTRFIQTVGYGLDENAKSAIEQWRFCPGTNSGQAIDVSLTVQVNFVIQ